MLVLPSLRQLLIAGLMLLVMLVPATLVQADPPKCDNNTSALCSACPSGSSTASGCTQANDDPAATCSTNGSGGSCDLVQKYVNPAINLLSILFGLLAVVSLIMAGINYATSEGDPQKAGKAKRRIANTVIGIVAYMFLYAFLQFIVPGGAFR